MAVSLSMSKLLIMWSLCERNCKKKKGWTMGFFQNSQCVLVIDLSWSLVLHPEKKTKKQYDRLKTNHCLCQSMIAALLATCLCVHVKSPQQRAAHSNANGSEKRVNHCCAVSHMLAFCSMAGVFQGLAKHWRNTWSLFMSLGPAREREHGRLREREKKRGGPQMMLKRR